MNNLRFNIQNAGQEQGTAPPSTTNPPNAFFHNYPQKSLQPVDLKRATSDYKPLRFFSRILKQEGRKSCQPNSLVRISDTGSDKPSSQKDLRLSPIVEPNTNSPK